MRTRLVRRLGAVASAGALLATVLVGTASTASATPASTPITRAYLSHAVVPADCGMPRQRLHNGTTAAKYLPAQGWIDKKHSIYAHFRGYGASRRYLVATYGCTAGGVGWPSWIVVYNAHGTLVAWINFGHHSRKQEHADLISWHASGRHVDVRWHSYEGAGFDVHNYRGVLRLSHGKIVLHRTS